MLEELKKIHKLEKEHLQILFEVMFFYETADTEYSMYTDENIEEMVLFLYDVKVKKGSKHAELFKKSNNHYLICALDLCEYGILDAYIVEDEDESKFMFEVNELFQSSYLLDQLYEEMCEIKEEKISVTRLH
ncbi:hypothetical protein [Peribacillus simplex]|uniref:hypothetical protein n=1 Tax=Peribacillus simplex TaxID=1478 RepID=UPI00285367CF|nr:hypothetical protein [Peribacillus simplex]MDR4928280.1 hypothetical protein [Peribacillus simplex]